MVFIFIFYILCGGVYSDNALTAAVLFQGIADSGGGWFPGNIGQFVFLSFELSY